LEEQQVNTLQQIGADFSLTRSAEAKESKPEVGLIRRVGAYNDKLFLAEHHMEKGWIGAAHSHPHDQIVYIISGHLKVRCAGQEFDARAGDSFVVRGGVEHQASAIEASHVIDVFTPCRHDYL
jgi:quercetin dioxygenase-like cupin family protein